MIKNEININDLIAETYKVPESSFDRKRTKTSQFMLNSVFSNSSIASTEYFVNAFIDDHGFPHSIERPIFVLFKMLITDQSWSKLADRIRTKNEYIFEYFCGVKANKNYIMMVFQVPDKYAADYDLFKLGKYSQLSKDYKKLFTQYGVNEKQETVESTIWRVLYKSSELRKELEEFFGDPVKFDKKDELWGIPQPKYEIYRYDEQRDRSAQV